MEDYIFEELQYLQYRDVGGLSGMRMLFRNDEWTPAAVLANFATSGYYENNNYSLDGWWNRKEVKFVSFLMIDYAHYNGIRFYYSQRNGLAIEEDIWSNENGGDWTSPRPVPDGQVIIGFKCNTMSDENYIRQLGLVLGVPG